VVLNGTLNGTVATFASSLQMQVFTESCHKLIPSSGISLEIRNVNEISSLLSYDEQMFYKP
jgi:hypothetical protein